MGVMVSATKTLASDPLSPVSCEVEPLWNGFVCPEHSTDAQMDIWGVWRLIQHFQLIVVFLKSFLNHVCFVARYIIIKNRALPSGNSISMKRFTVCGNAEVVDVCQSDIHMDGRAKISPGEHCSKNHLQLPAYLSPKENPIVRCSQGRLGTFNWSST